MCNELEPLGQFLDQILVDQPGYGSAAKGPICGYHLVVDALPALFDEFLSVFGFGLDYFRDFGDGGPFFMGAEGRLLV